jgi:hypothetical protein
MEAAIRLGGPGTPRDVANAALFLAFDEVSCITGTTCDRRRAHPFRGQGLPYQSDLGRPRRVRSATTPPIARLAKTNDQRVSSGRLWRTFHVQSPSRLDKTRLYLVSRQAVELPIPASTHLLRKSGQKQGFITRMKAEPNDQIAGDCCDLVSRRVKEWQSHRGARCRSGPETSTSLPVGWRPGHCRVNVTRVRARIPRSIPTMRRRAGQVRTHRA